ncbi:MAG: response regulator transcription factor [Roseivirga sp.]|nr:response regulator transcription factor [Roseivirga sp.]
MNAVIIDNEPHMISSLKALLGHYCPEVQVIGSAEGCESGEKLILELNPEVVFLDVEMDDGTGIELVEKLSYKQLHVIFITAHDKYAIDAFKCSAIDFLLKPVDPDDLVGALKKFDQAKRVNDLEKQVSVLTEHLRGGNSRQKKIVLSDYESMHLVKIEDIIWCVAEGSYTRFKLLDGPEIMVSKNLKSYEEILAGQDFIRIHNSYLVNINHIKRFERTEGGVVIMENGGVLPVSVRKKDSLMNILKNWNK